MSTLEDRLWDEHNDRIADDQARGNPTNGMCLACGSIEVLINEATGMRDFSHIGESDRYPTGYGCEVCS